MVMEPAPLGRTSGSAPGADPTAAGARSVLLREGSSRCTQHGCDATSGIECSYVDRRSNRCETAWCPEHRLVFGEDVYCRRHAGVVTALFQHDESLPTIFPDIDNRAPSLVAWVVRGIDADVWRLLLEEVGDEGGGQLIAERVTLVFLGVERRRAWERSWKLVTHTGVARRVSIIVEERRDSEVIVRVDSRDVDTAVPPWIQHRLNHERVDPDDDARERAAFNARLSGAIAESLRAARDRDSGQWGR